MNVYIAQYGTYGCGHWSLRQEEPYFTSRSKLEKMLRTQGFKRNKPKNSYELWENDKTRVWAKIVTCKKHGAPS